MRAVRWKKFILLAGAGLAALVLVSLLVLDQWLESDAGRARLQSAVEQAIGMPIRLEGEFSVRLFPTIGVSGDGLVLGTENGGGPLLRCDSYHTSLAIWPLLRGRIEVSGIYVSGGVLRPDRWMQSPVFAANSDRAGAVLPSIEYLEISDFQIAYSGEGGPLLNLKSLVIESFAAGARVPVRAELSLDSDSATLLDIQLRGDLSVDDGLAEVDFELADSSISGGGYSVDGLEGILSWKQPASAVEIDLAGAVEGIGMLKLRGDHQAELQQGQLRIELVREGQPDSDFLSANHRVGEDEVLFNLVQLSAAGQSLDGYGCLELTEPVTVHADLRAGELNLEAIQAALPASAAAEERSDEAGQGSTLMPDLPFGLQLRISIDRAVHSDTVASGVVLGVGPEPDCPGMTTATESS